MAYTRFRDGFEITTASAIDKRMLLTKAEMLQIEELYNLPDKYLILCTDDNNIYVYDSSITTPDPEIGKFRAYEDIIDIPAAVLASMQSAEGKAAMEASISVALPGAIADAMVNPETTEQLTQSIATTMPEAMAKVLADPELGEQLVNNMFDNNLFEKNVDDKISLSISCIEAIDGN